MVGIGGWRSPTPDSSPLRLGQHDMDQAWVSMT